MKKASCENCLFRHNEDGGLAYVCRRYPPQVVIYLRDTSTASEEISEFPDVALSDWCGEHAFEE